MCCRDLWLVSLHFMHFSCISSCSYAICFVFFFQLYLVSLHCAFDQRFFCEDLRGLLPSPPCLLLTPPSPLLSLVVHIPIAGNSIPETIISPGNGVRTDGKRGQVRTYLGEPSNSSGDTALEMAQKGSLPSLSFGSAGTVPARGELWGPFE